MKLKYLFFVIIFVLLGAITIGCSKADIKVEQLNLTLHRTESYTLVYEVENSDSDVKIEVADPNILSVEGNKITALKVGSTTVTLSLVDKPKVVQEISVTVLEVELKLSLNGERAYIGGDNKIDAVFVPSTYTADIEFSSSDVSIATIDNQGNVTALRVGTVEITASYDGMSSSISFEVVLPENFDFELSVDDDLNYGLYKTCQVDVNSSNPNLVALGFSYLVNNTVVATIDDNGMLSLLKPGTVTVVAVSKVDARFTSTLDLEITLDPIALVSSYNIEHPFVANIRTFGSTEMSQLTYGSVSLYANMDMNLIEKIIPLSSNKYAGQTATEDLLAKVEPEKLVRSGILHTSTSKITYHDTGNNSAGADAMSHANYLVGTYNASDRARSWHYTVDDGCVIHHIPDNEVTWQGDSYGAYSTSIGIETCVNYGCDLEKVWHRTAKLMSSLLVKYDMEYSDIKQHYDWMGKNCPQTLRMNGKYDYAVDMIKAEYEVLTLLEGYNVEFKSLNPEYVDDIGRVIALPATATTISYLVHITGENYDESTILYSTLEGEDGSTIDMFDMSNVKAFNNKILTLNVNELDNVIDSYYKLNSEERNRATSISLLVDVIKNKNENTNVPDVSIEQVYLGQNTQYAYIQIKNNTNNELNANDYVIRYGDDTTEGDNYFVLPFGKLEANKSYLIGCQKNNGFSYYIYPEYLSKINLETSGSVSVIEKANNAVIDKLEYDSSSNTSAVYLPNTYLALTRLSYTNNMKDNYLGLVEKPENSKGEGLLSGGDVNSNALDVDMLILELPATVTESDKDNIDAIYEFYNMLSAKDKAQVRYYSILKEKKLALDSLLDPDMAIINMTIDGIPEQIINDYELPTYEGLTYSYVEGEDNTLFDLNTGTLLKTTYAYAPTKILVSYKNSTKVITINFGLLKEGQHTVFNTSKIAPSGGTTAEGYGTYDQQKNGIGFGGYMIIVGDAVYFIGEGAYIELNSPNQNIGLYELRPYGTTSDTTAINNQGLVKGVPKNYNGSGALYYNNTDHALTFDPTNSYGRANAAVYGYDKAVFSPREDGTFEVSRFAGNTGDNTSTSGTSFTLNPGEYFWTPHTYEVNLNGGTALTHCAGGSLGVVEGVLEVGVKLEIVAYKIVGE